VKEKKIPPKDKLIELIKQAVSTRIKIDSQEELADLVLFQLRKEDKKFTLSPTRAKRIALEIPEIEVRAKTKRVIGLQKIERCPICESQIIERRVKNLVNRDIVIGYKCTKCGYESDLEAFMPMKYIFVWKRR
jgi:predicted RNA-binding Zn-ribbon protein involved in translation (DUF1610 family)